MHIYAQNETSKTKYSLHTAILNACTCVIMCFCSILGGNAHSQVYISQAGNYICSPSDAFTITMTVGIPYQNPVIWVDGQPHAGLSYTIQTTTEDNPREYLYYGTVTLNYMGHLTNWDSRVDGPARSGDLICIDSHVQNISFPNSYLLYERAWVSADGTLNGHDVPSPPITTGKPGYPVSLQQSSTMQMNYDTNGMGAANGVTVEGQSVTTLLDGPDQIWTFTSPWTSSPPGTGFTITTPALPGYIYTHTLQHTYLLSVVFAYQPPAPQQRERRVIDASDPITTKVYAVFKDPNAMFPPYHQNDVLAASLEHRPWYEVIDAAIAHITQDGAVRTVTAEPDAMARLTTDLYVFSNRPNGPSTKAKYDFRLPSYYGINVRFDSTELRFNLWDMINDPIGDCRDFAAFLECHAKSVGISNVQKIRLTGPFNFKPLMNCGSNTFIKDNFAYHQIVYLGGNVYDWAVGFQSGGTPAWILALNFTKTQEINAIVLSSGFTDWTSPFSLGAADPNVNNLPTLLGPNTIP